MGLKRRKGYKGKGSRLTNAISIITIGYDFVPFTESARERLFKTPFSSKGLLTNF